MVVAESTDRYTRHLRRICKRLLCENVVGPAFARDLAFFAEFPFRRLMENVTNAVCSVLNRFS